MPNTVKTLARMADHAATQMCCIVKDRLQWPIPNKNIGGLGHQVLRYKLLTYQIFMLLSVYLLLCFIRNLFHGLINFLVNRFLIDVSVSF